MLMNKIYHQRGQRRSLWSRAQGPPQRGTALRPHRPHELKSHGDPDASLWGANNGLAQYSDRPFTLSARASHWPAKRPPASSVQTAFEPVGNPAGVLALARKVICRLRFMCLSLFVRVQIADALEIEHPTTRNPSQSATPTCRCRYSRLPSRCSRHASLVRHR